MVWQAKGYAAPKYPRDLGLLHPIERYCRIKSFDPNTATFYRRHFSHLYRCQEGGPRRLYPLESALRQSKVPLREKELNTDWQCVNLQLLCPKPLLPTVRVWEVPTVSCEYFQTNDSFKQQNPHVPTCVPDYEAGT